MPTNLIKAFPLLCLICCLFITEKAYSQHPERSPENMRSRHWEHPHLLSETEPSGSSGLTMSNARSDTFDIQHVTINLDMTEMQNQHISGSCEIAFESKMNLQGSLTLDLLALTVDSVTMSGNPLTFSHNDTLLVVQLSQPLNTGQSETLIVHYQGSPVMDASGWGGFYFSGDYAFNLGVGFDAKPHNYGRTWYPCFDNFVERATYDFNVTTAGTKRASCNGLLTGTTPLNGDTMVWHYNMPESIPSYLVNVAVADYVTINSTYNGVQGSIPIELHAVANDTNNVKSSFVNLNQAMNAFETRFGPYRFSKVGYSMVPFGGGAMEHASNITYPRFAVNGGLGSETLMAHELAHMWFGDLATCRTAEDMWLNEGWASFCELIFLEDVYGRQAYLDQLLPDHLEMLRYLHLNEDGYRAVSGVPHEYTYGAHVYTKGAIVAHSLRGYMGDADFFSSLRNYLNNNEFTDVSSADFRDALETASGRDLHDFFDNWVFAPGWPHFAVDAMEVTPTPGLTDVEVDIRQKITGAPTLYNNVPLEIRFLDADWNEVVILDTVSGEITSLQYSLPIEPVYVDVNPNYLISHAVTGHQEVINSTGQISLPRALMDNFQVTAVTDSAFVRIQHHWAEPTDFITTAPVPYLLSSRRFWSVKAVGSFEATARITYDGREPAGFLDEDLLNLYDEDSLVLLHRSSPEVDWALYPHYTKNMLNNPLDQFGVMELSQVLPGEYTLAAFDRALSVYNPTKDGLAVKVFPNPSNGLVNFDLSGWQPKNVQLQLRDLSGRIVLEQTVQGGQQISVNTENLTAGSYLFTVRQDEEVRSGRVLLTP